MFIYIKKEENYVRLVLLLKEVAPGSVRTLFDRECPPTHLSSTLNTNYNTLVDLKLKRIVNQAQWNLLFPRIRCRSIGRSNNVSRVSRVKGENLRSVKSGNYIENQTVTTRDERTETNNGPFGEGTLKRQIKHELEKWEEDDKTYIETNGARSILKCIKENGCVVVTRSSGCGKSSLARHVALQMQKGGFNVLPVTTPDEIITWYNLNKKNLFVVDDFCGTYTLNPIKYENWKNCMQKIKTFVEMKQVKLIMSCRLQVYRDEQMKTLSFFLSFYKEEIDKLQTEGAHGKYCALALCVMFNNCLKEEWLIEDVDKDIKKIIKNTYEMCKVVKGTSRLVLRDELDSLSQTFIRKDSDVYRTIHDKLFDFLAFYFGSVMLHCLINNANATSRLIR
ncbi:unnamed protein product [Mytilus coruscus]|uniref:Novel STAND NTPase 3 domain-containing protein n=1 Tax=Mytilus coruscus TaxID=42192 RepID=A0A6J8EC07_MYTCO|nr:unnamed protein product [Mytilus coruscus]